MTRPWQTRRSHTDLDCARQLEALCAVATDVLDLYAAQNDEQSDVPRRYVETLARWCRGEAKSQDIAAALRALDAASPEDTPANVALVRAHRMASGLSVFRRWIADFPTHLYRERDAQLRRTAAALRFVTLDDEAASLNRVWRMLCDAHARIRRDDMKRAWPLYPPRWVGGALPGMENGR